jgi:hypothetical protein
VRCTLDLPMPALGGGAFAVTGLQLGASFRLAIKPENGKLDFALGVGANLGRKTQPFALTIAFLSGGGWLEADALYHPNTGALDATVTLGIVAGATAVFAFGPAQGGVYIYFGIKAEYARRSAQGGGGGLSVGILLLAGGNITLLGYISINIQLLLEANYESTTGRLIGSGTLSVSIRICWCVTVSVSAGVQYTFAGNKAANTDDHYQQFE